MGLPTLALALCLVVASLSVINYSAEAMPQSPSDTALIPSGGDQIGAPRPQSGAGSDVQGQPEGAAPGERRRGGRKGGRRNRPGQRREGAGGKRCRTPECKKERRLRRKQRREQRRQRKAGGARKGGRGGGRRRRKDRKQRPQGSESPAAGESAPQAEPQN